MNEAEFRDMLAKMEYHWSRNEGTRTLEYFAEDVHFANMPERDSIRSREALRDYFAQFSQTASVATEMKWHSQVFDETQQIGAAEYSFQMPPDPDGKPQQYAHGMIWIKLKDGKIQTFREYYHYTENTWEDWVFIV